MMNASVDESAAALAALNRRLLEAMARPLEQGGGLDGTEILKMLVAGLAQDRERWQAIQNDYYQRQLALWSAFFRPSDAGSAPPVVSPAPGDRRFRAGDWQQPYWNYVLQSYLLLAGWLGELSDAARLAPQERRKVSFFLRQIVDAVSPANFPWSNPEALRLAAESRGESLKRGLRNLAADLDKGMVSMTDESAFEVGRNLAITPGAVVYENDFMQLIQYRPATEQVYSRPLLIVPPCINKYYILDLQPENSFVQHAVAAGHTVFMVSWRNMPESMGTASWDDYLEHGVIRAIDVAARICGTLAVNTLGFCVGGTLLGAALAVLRAKGRKRAASVTLLTAMLDFSDTGELSVFVDDAYVAKREQEFAAGGLLRGRELALTFASLRANDLIWNYVVNNYLKGKTPEPFDLLYWNADSTNLPGVMYAYYVRNMYLENSLRIPDRLVMCGVPVDLSRIDQPAYVLATREDHIVPWRTAYATTQLLKGKIRFALAASGHIAGVVNPASRNKRNYWINDALPQDPEHWLESATSHPGSWWADWSRWLAKHAGKRVPARSRLGGDRYNEIEPAPGRYVKEKCA